MDLLIDGQCLQSASRSRGIGRYTRNLLRGIATARPRWRVRIVQLANLPPIADDDLCGWEVFTFTPPVPVRPFDVHSARVNGLYYGDWLCAHRPDAILLTSLPGEHQTVVPEFTADRRPHVAAVSYDFIPMVFPQWFLSNEVVEAWYRRGVEALLGADTILSISQASADDLHRFFPTWEGRSEVISGAPDPLFAPLAEGEAATHLRRLAARHGIAGEFLLCCASSPDRHKNLDGAVRAYSALPPAVRERHRLVIAGPVRNGSTLAAAIEQSGVANDVTLVGQVSDDELKALYHACRLFLCPSFYEGLGLPVLEALQCGAPVVTSTDSSLPEVGGGVSWLCDTRSPVEFATAIEAALAEPRDARLPLRLAHARKFNWPRTAELTCKAIEAGKLPRKPRVAWVGTPPTALAGDTTHDLPALLRTLAARFDLHVVVESPALAGPDTPGRVISLAQFHWMWGYDLIIYAMVDDHASGFVVPRAVDRPGVVLALSDSLDGLVADALHRHPHIRLAPPPEGEVNGGRLLRAASVGLVDGSTGGLGSAAEADLRFAPGSDPATLVEYLLRVIEERRAADAPWVEQVTGVTAAAVGLKAVGARATSDQMLARWSNLRGRRFADAPASADGRDRVLWVDVSTLFDNIGSYTGITRTVHRLAKSFLARTDTRVGFFRYSRERDGFVGVRPAYVDLLLRQEGNNRDPAWRELSAVPFQADPDDVALFPGFDLGYPHTLQRLWRAVGCGLAFVLYDGLPHKFPQWFTTSSGPLYPAWLANAIQVADLAFCISDCTRQDLRAFADHYGLVATPAAVVRLGDGDLSELTPAASPPFAARLRPPEACGFVMLVSTIEVRKNHALAYQAWRRLLQKHGPVVVPKLVFVGSVGWMTGDLLAQIQHDPVTRDHLVVLSGTSDAELAWLYTNCTLALYPSLYEGWGLPVAEALAFGKMCIASDASAIPEIGGDLVDYHDPHDLPGFLRLVERAIFDPEYRAERERQIAERFRRTHWDDTAAQIVDAVEAHFGPTDTATTTRPLPLGVADAAIKRPA
ncbi:MAG: glycosyltransferase family 4 protein [Fimbriiglobus sp.]|jgi:glycosyltransferase involved in cell wall biosynthesis|nr:glycosyltransferase family 4 protein [Fimbriiglobus sp.]